MSTDTFPFSVTYSNAIFEVLQPTNGNTVCTFPQSQSIIKTHPSAANLYFFGTNNNLIALDFTLCTNLTVVSRQLQIEAIIALASSSPLGSVTISGQPIQVNPTVNLSEVYSLSNTLTASGPALRLRPNGTTVRITHLSCATNTALSSGNSFYLTRGATVTGGTWAASATIPGSKVEVNTGGAVSAGTQELFFILGTSSIVDVSNLNLTYTTLNPFILGLNQTGLGTTSVSITWTELP